MKWLIPIIAGAITLILILIIVFSKILIKPSVENDQSSADRMSTISEIMTDHFGYNWPNIVFTFVMLFVVIFVLLYVISLKEIEIPLTEKHFNIIKWLLLAITASVVLILLIYSITTITKYRNDQAIKRRIEGEYSTTTKLDNILQILGLIMGFLAVLIAMGWVFVHFWKKS